MDNEFSSLELNLQGVVVNCCAANKHRPEAERTIWVIRDQVCTYFCVMPFKRIPAIMLVELIKFCIFWLNLFPAAQGVSKTLGPRQIVVETKLDWNLHCCIPYSHFVLVSKDNIITNPHNIPWAVATICSGPIGNAQGTYQFLSLATEEVIK